jgi:predicted transcriptional regulator
MGKRVLPTMPAHLADGADVEIIAGRVVLARKVIRRRWDAGLTQADLARRAGIRKETLWRIETAKVTAERATVEKILRVLDATEKDPRSRGL